MVQSRSYTGFKRKHARNNFGKFSFDIEASGLELHVKESALKTAHSVVCLKSYSGDEQLFICCGIIMECEHKFGTSMATILTSATLLRCRDGEAKLASDLKINVYGVDGKSAEGGVVAVDFHYNVATIEVHSVSLRSIPTIRLVDNVVELGVSGSKHPHGRESVSSSNRFRLYPGDKVLALARYFREPYDIMVASGKVSFGRCEFDCKELLESSCKIKKNGIGGPLINLYGEVIGINFYEASYTPFLPMNIIIKCFNDLKKNGHISRPSLGVVVSDLYTTDLQNLENVRNKFPLVAKGAIIEEVPPDSPGHIAGLCADDVIISCAGASVGSCLELTEMLWGKEGKRVELTVVRASSAEQLRIFVDAVAANPTENRWPVPKLQFLRPHSAF